MADLGASDRKFFEGWAEKLILVPAEAESQTLNILLAEALGEHGPTLRRAQKVLAAGGAMDAARVLVPSGEEGWLFTIRQTEGGRAVSVVTRRYSCVFWTAGDATVCDEEGLRAVAEAATPALALAAAACLARADALAGRNSKRRRDAAS